MTEGASQPIPSRGSRPVSEFLYENTIGNPMRFVGLIAILLLAAISIHNISIGEYTAKTFTSQLIIGLAQGSIYALIALGYTLVYGILFMINFAHGEVFMTGAYMGFFAITFLSEIKMEDGGSFLENQTVLALLITVMVAVMASVLIAVLLERIAYRPLRGAPRLVPLITAIGASIAIRELFQLLFGADPRRYPSVNLFVLPGIAGCEMVDGAQVCPGIDIISGFYDVQVFDFELRLRPIIFVVFFVALLLMTLLWFFVQHTKTGKAMRAVAEDKDTASLMGINVDRVIVVTFILGAAMAGAAAVLFVFYNRPPLVTPGMGFLPGIKAFTAAVLGGIGNVPGAMFGGLFLGVVESVLPSMLGLDNQLKDLIAFSTLVLFMIFRPTGIFGEVLSEKKA